MEVTGQIHALAAWTLGKNAGVPCGRLDGTQNRNWHFRDPKKWISFVPQILLP